MISDNMRDGLTTLGVVAVVVGAGLFTMGYYQGYHNCKKNMEKKENTGELIERISALEARMPPTNVPYQIENPITNSNSNLAKRAVDAAGYAYQPNQKQATQAR